MPGGEIIQASWNRCVQDYGLEPCMRRDVERVTEQNIRELRSRMEEIIFESDSITEHLRHVARDADYCLLLSDATGIVVQGYADTSASRELAEEGLATGSRWNENSVGTNGIGTCIVSRRPVTVAGQAHYNHSLKGFTCTAAPIFAPDGQVVAVLDFSGRSVANSSECSFAQHIVREAAATISTALFRKCHQNSCIVALSREPESMPLALTALVATDESGRLLGATQEALSFLGVAELADLGGLHLQDLWRVALDDLKPLTSHNVRLSATDGTDFYVTTFLPKKKVRSGPVRQAKAVQKSRSSKNDPLALDRVAGSDPKMRRNVELCRKLLDRDIPLLLLGETGVGKDTFARAVHMESNRASNPYVAVNCAAIPDTLLASELFGYAPGTFTGGLKAGRMGKIAASNGGTLFLDEIGDMPIDLQAHLLRVLEEREVSPLGASEAISVDVRIISATHRDLPQLVEAGRFRRDLYYRIKGAQISVSPLRERADIIELVNKVIEDEQEEGAAHTVLAPEVQELFANYRWPGNIRELRNVIRWILSVHSDPVITLDHLPDELLDSSLQPLVPADAVGSITNVSAELPASATLEHACESMERKRIIDALTSTKWCITTAASDLGISRATLHRKIRKHNILSPNQKV